MKVALLSDSYLPRLGGIEVQVHDLAAQLTSRGHHVEVFTATPGRHGERHGAAEVVDGITVHRMALRLPWDLPVNPLAPLTMRDRLATFDVAHVHMGVVSPFAVDAAFLTRRIGLPTAMTWHCMLDRFATVVSALGVVRRWAAGGMAMSAVRTSRRHRCAGSSVTPARCRCCPTGSTSRRGGPRVRDPTTVSSGSSRRCVSPTGSVRCR